MAGAGKGAVRRDANEPDAGRQSTGEKVLKGSFWLIAAIHITVFTVIGATTRQWRLLVIFLIGFVITMAVWAMIKIAIRKRKRQRKSPPQE